MDLESLAVIYSRSKKHYATSKKIANENKTDQFLQNCMHAAQRELYEAREQYFRELRNFQSGKTKRRHKQITMLTRKKDHVATDIASMLSCYDILFDDRTISFSGSYNQFLKLSHMQKRYLWIKEEINRCNGKRRFC